MTDRRTYDLDNQATLDADSYLVVDKLGWPEARRLQGSILNDDFVLKAGDTMTGALTINANSAAALLVEQDGVNDDVLLVDTGTPQVDVNGAFNVQGVTVFNDAGVDVDFRVESNDVTEMLFVNAGLNRVGVRAGATPAATLHIKQTGAGGALPVLGLNQSDVSEEFIRFIGTAAAGVLTQSIVDEGDQASETREGWVKVYVQDDGNQITDQAYFIPIYTLSA